MLSQIIDNQNKLLLEKEQEIAELKKECRRCVYTDCPCILSDYGKDRNGICDHFKDVFDENTELKDKLNNLASVAEVRLANWQKYKKENAALELKIKKMTQHLEPQTMTALFEQVEEEAKQEELLNSTLAENKEIYKKMSDLDTALEDCTESLTDARIKIKELEAENEELKSKIRLLQYAGD